MNKILQFALLCGILLTAISLSAQIRSCYDIQYTTNSSGDSPYLGQSVTVEAIVSGINFHTSYSNNNYRGFFLTDDVGGPFKGLFVYSATYQPQVGDRVLITGTVIEYYSFTEIAPVTNFQIISSGNPLPEPTVITTSALTNSNTAEQWEACLVKVLNVNVTSNPSVYQEFNVNDGSGNCQIDNGFFDIGHTWQNIHSGSTFISIMGIVDYTASNYGLNPRSLNEMVQDQSTLMLTTPSSQQTIGAYFNVPVVVSGISNDNPLNNYQMNIAFNPTVLQYISVNTAGTLSSGGSMTTNPTAGAVSVQFSNNTPISSSGTLFNLSFRGANAGTSPITVSNVSFNGTPMTTINSGAVIINSTYNSLGDTLTVIQLPILNIPDIVIPGESMVITCVAPQSTSGWQANLLHGSKIISLPVNSTQYVTTPDRWLLTVTVPNVPVYELYNLQVLASGGISDVTRNAVQVVPTRKTNYYFAHITDLHMPTRIEYPDAGYDTDSLSVVDFRAVMDDLNLIRPEFVLITGDIINEGEIENFSNQYWFGWVQKVLSELQIPFYLVTGNHDIGGWNATPPPAGSSRRNWWRYFGWKWLDNASTTWPYHTQDYSFHYGNTHFIGLEAYNNYENWRTNIYGSDSFTTQQMNWLNTEININPNETKVLFFHYDFTDQINMTALSADMELWGHTHSNSGSLTTTPYSISTRSTCDGNRAYRIIRVNGSSLQPYSSIYAGASGSTINVNYFPNNYGFADSVRATITNGQPLAFENAMIEFKMPSGGYTYDVTGGILEQVDTTGDFNTCYVRINLTANSTVNVTISGTSTPVLDDVQAPAIFKLQNAYPNPFRSGTSFNLQTPKTIPLQIRVYNLKGELVNNLYSGYSEGTEQLFTWNGKTAQGSDAPTGMYLIRVQSGTQVKTLKTIKIQ